MVSSIYSPLRGDGRQFRLLAVKPSADRLAPLRCELNEAFFDNDDLEYTALSYTWGDTLVTAPIFVKGEETQVTLNLEAALRHIRKSSHDIVLWVDALCINQNDVSEKNHQVEMMREIFSGAELVVAWLGSASEDSDLAMELLGTGLDVLWESEEGQHNSIEEIDGRETGTWTSVSNDTASDHAAFNEAYLTAALARIAASDLVDTTRGPQLSNPTAGSILEDTCAFPGVDHAHNDEHPPTDQFSISSSSRSSSDLGLNDAWRRIELIRERLSRQEVISITRLLTRSWWSRIWVVQEVLLAKKVLFKCGDAEISGEQIRDNEAPLHSLKSSIDRDLMHQFDEARRVLEDIDNWQETKNNASTYLFRYGDRQATRPHDHVYGLYGIISKDDRLWLGAPDYDCAVEDLFISVATKSMLREKSLLLLEVAATCTWRTEESSIRIHLPSWVPDWTRPLNSRGSTLFHWNNPFSEPESRFSEDSKELLLNFCEIEKIESIRPVPELAQGEMPILWHNALETSNGQRSRALQGIIVALFIAYGGSTVGSLENQKGFEFVAVLFQELEEYRISLCRDEAGEVNNDADYLAGFIEWAGDSRQGRTDEEILENVFGIQAAHSFVNWYHRQSTADIRSWYRRYSFVRKERAKGRMFRTYKGSFGITAFPEVNPGDIICVGPTCSAPLVLRKVQSSKHMLIGLCNPISWMEGNGLAQAVERGEIVDKLFTLV